MLGDVHQCFSVDFVNENDEHAHHYLIMFLNSLHLSGLPPHRLNLKCGQYVMLLKKNLNSTKSLCNSNRLHLLQVSSSVLLCEIVKGCCSFNNLPTQAKRIDRRTIVKYSGKGLITRNFVTIYYSQWSFILQLMQ